jgi:predicted extracellular nuclease
MKKNLLSFLFLLISTTAWSQVRIHEFYGGGGNSGAPYNADYALLYNAGASPVNLGTHSLQYASATGTTWSRLNLSGTIAPNGVFLVKLSATGSNGAALPTPDVDGTAISASATNGKLALMSNQTTITAGTSDPTTAPGYVDFLGFGTANASEGGAAAPAPSNTTAIRRNNTTSNDTNNNGADFVTSPPNPYNSSKPLPVTLLSFVARLNERGQTDLRWTTVSERDNAYFEIQRSKNAQDFEAIARIDGRQHPTAQRLYFHRRSSVAGH